MKSFFLAGAVFAAKAYADLCSTVTPVDDDGNYYCAEVTGITYTGLDGSGSYDRVYNMDADSGACNTTPESYTGSMSPLDQELSFHFRGPLQLKQFAAYTTTTTSTSKMHRRRSSSLKHEHSHSHLHNHHKEIRAVEEAPVQRRQEGTCEEVTAVIDGATVSWLNDYMCTTAASSAASTSAAATTATATTTAETSSTTATAASVAHANEDLVSVASSSSTSETSASSSASSASSNSISSTSSSTSSSASSTSTGAWSQTAYYGAESQTAHGLVFLNHLGGSTGASGTWSKAFGSSLSYASTDGLSGVDSPQILADTEIPSTGEVVIMSDTECGANDGDCGYYLPNTTAYHGFGGSTKAFFFEFAMPDEPSQETSSTSGNMPAIWALNALIPRTSQYSSCSCWESGCGELDIFEVLAPGDSRAKSTIHGNSPCSGGDSDYFARPTSDTIFLGLIMSESNIQITVMDTFAFDTSLDASYMSDLVESLMTQDSDVSVFPLAA